MCVRFGLAWNQNGPGFDSPPHRMARIESAPPTLRNEVVRERPRPRRGEASAQLGAQEATARRRGTATTATATATVNASPPTSTLPATFSPVKRRVLPLSSSSLGFLVLSFLVLSEASGKGRGREPSGSPYPTSPGRRGERVRERRGAARRPAAACARGAGGQAMGEVAALRQLVGQVQELWDLYGANAQPVPRQGERTKSLLPPVPLAPPPLVTPLSHVALSSASSPTPALRGSAGYGGLQSHRQFADIANCFLFVCSIN
jgi:hypothetical protein